MQTQATASLEKRALEKTRVFAMDLSEHCTHELTLHTRLRVAGLCDYGRQQRVYRAQAAMRHFQPRFHVRLLATLGDATHTECLCSYPLWKALTRTETD